MSILGGLSGIVVNLFLFVMLRRMGTDFMLSLGFSVHLALVWNYLMKAYLYAVKPGLKKLLEYYAAHFLGTIAILVSGNFLSQLEFRPLKWLQLCEHQRQVFLQFPE